MIDIKETFQTVKSRENFLRGLAILATVDNVVDEAEKKFFTDAAVGLDLPAESIDSISAILGMPPSDNAKLSLVFDNKKQSLVFIREAIQLSHIDGDYCESERRYINKVAQSLDIQRSSVDALEAWVVEGMTWSRRGDDLIAKLEVS